MSPTYDLDKIKFATDEATFRRGVDLYERGKVTDVEEALGDFTAVVHGMKLYRVLISGRRYTDAHCSCYLGEKGTLCKHVVALALHAVSEGRPLREDEKQQGREARCSPRREVLSKDELSAVRKSITAAMNYIKPYTGPSRTWFANQDSLGEGCNRLRAIVSDLPVNRQASEVLVKLLLRLDRKLCTGGVDDSNGIVGGFINELVHLLTEHARIDRDCVKAFRPLAGIGITSFGWEEPLVRIFDEGLEGKEELLENFGGKTMKKDKMPDKRALEKVTSDLTRLLDAQEFASVEDAREILDSVVQGGKVPAAKPRSAVQFAQDIMYEAWDAESRKERIKLAKEALSISADCADAYNLLAEEEARTLEKSKGLYQEGVDAGRRALGEDIFREVLENGEEGHFWGYTRSRPYMRSRAGLMECLWAMGNHDEAIAHAKEMLVLNPNDNQGIRYILTAYWADLERYDQLDDFMRKEYVDDCSAEWLYTRALVSFVKEGDSRQSDKELKDALKRNAYVPEYLCGNKSIPRDLPDSITMGGEDEGYCYASRYLGAWKRAPGAIDWLMDRAGVMNFSKTGRNALCPCGSGKKFKKCCGA